jgi:3-oxoadipate enol-lactonase
MPLIQSFAEVNGTRLYYEMAGSGNPVIFIHGFGADSRVWDAQFKDFAEQYLVIRYDIRGHGKSAVPSGEAYSHVNDLNALLAHLNISKVSCIGHSLGGGIAIDFALAYPEKTTSIVLVDSTIDGYQLSDEWNDSWAPVYTEFAVSGASKALPILLAHPIFASCFRQAALKARLTEILSDYSGWHILNHDPFIASDPPAAQCLSQIQTKVLILVGELDLPDFHAMSNKLFKEIPNAKKIAFRDTGHVLPMEAPEKFKEVVIRFFEGNRE